MSTEATIPLTYAQLVDELRQACVEKRTGTMMIATQDNQLARILLRDGDIVSVSYRLQSGRAAVPLLKDIKQARVKFSHVKTGGEAGGGDLPSTPEIMQILGGDKPAAAAPAAPIGSMTVDEIPKVLKIIEAELIEVLGPLANIVWTEHLERANKPLSGSRLRLLVDGLAKEIGDPTKVQLFREQVWQKIGSVRSAR